jgi:outer membrane cobalamin receptor
VTVDATALWSAGVWTADLRWHLIGRRYPNSAGTNPHPAFSLLDLGLERRIIRALAIRGDLHDVTDTRPEFIAGYPTPGRSFTLTLNFVLP